MSAVLGEATTARGIAEALVGAPVESLEQVGGGRNSRVYRVRSARGPFALKQYPSRADDPRDRIGTEAGALRWMAAHGIGSVPRLVAVDAASNFALLSWADGKLVQDVGPADIDQAADFLRQLHRLRDHAAMAPERLATEACLSGAEIERQVSARVASLDALTDKPELAAFLTDEFRPAQATLFARARAAMAATGLPFDRELDQSKRSLTPSDFGFHNALRAADGRLTFIDFEYFGWDDPVKLAADVLFHPGTPVAPALRARFRAAALDTYGTDPSFAARLDALEPLFGLRWVLILLNEFHPERWRRRVLAGADEAGWADAKRRQLQRASAMLGRALGKGDDQA